MDDTTVSIWTITQETYGTIDQVKRLAEGYEPFAVYQNQGELRVVLRKKIYGIEVAIDSILKDGGIKCASNVRN